MCRTYNGYDINWHDSWKKALEEVAATGELKHVILTSPRSKVGRGNISPVTVIFPTLAMRSKMQVAKKLDKKLLQEELMKQLVKEFGDDVAFSESEIKDTINFKSTVYADALNKAIDKLVNKDEVIDEFMKLLEQKVEEARKTLFERFEWQCSQSEKSARFMYENNTMYGYIPEEGIKSALKHGTTVIGQIGMAETLQILIGDDQTSKKGMELAKKIELFMNTRCKEYKMKYKMNVGNYLTPAENLSFTSMKKFQKEFGKIDKISDHDYFTNSIHIPVWKKMTPFDKIEKESQLTGYSNAGCITYVELDASAKNNIEALEKLVIYAMEHDIPYFAINVPSDSCECCGYQGLIDGNCPQCGSDNIQRLRRVTGYLTGDYKSSFNKGKQQETEMRVKHNGVEVK